MKSFDYTNLCFLFVSFGFVLRGFIKRVINHPKSKEHRETPATCITQCKVAEVSPLVQIFFFSFLLQKWRKLGKIVLTLGIFHWNGESAILSHSHIRWIFSSSDGQLIPTSTTPPTSAAQPGLTLNHSLSCEICKWAWLFHIIQSVECFLNDANTLQTVPRLHFFLRFKSSESTAAAGVMNQVVCLCSLWSNAFAVNAPLEPSSCISIVLSMQMLSNTTNALPCYIFLGGFHLCLPLSKRGRTGSAVTFIAVLVCERVCACIRSLSLYLWRTG